MMDTPSNRKPFFALIFGMLCVLTGMSFWVANSHLMDQPATGWGVMMAIAATKALLVVLFFMHLWWEQRWKYVLTIPAMVIGAILVLLLVPDVGNRFETYSKTRRLAAPEPVLDSVNPVGVNKPTVWSKLPVNCGCGLYC